MFFFFNDTATTEIYTLSLHDALPIWIGKDSLLEPVKQAVGPWNFVEVSPLPHGAFQSVKSVKSLVPHPAPLADRKSTRLNSSHANISYAVFCLKKKKKCNMSSTKSAL